MPNIVIDSETLLFADDTRHISYSWATTWWKSLQSDLDHHLSWIITSSLPLLSHIFQPEILHYSKQILQNIVSHTENLESVHTTFK